MNKVYEIVQKNILSRLEDAIKNNEPFQWIKPWNGMSPTNFKTKKPYSGINLLLLDQGGYYLTFNQVKELGGYVKKGSKQKMIVFWNFKKVDNLSEEEAHESSQVSYDNAKTKVVFRYYNVFHQSDIEGIDFNANEITHSTVNLDAEYIISNYSNIVPIVPIENSDKAFYRPDIDQIQVPCSSQFINIDEYYSTIFHEMTHSTGHETRLNRNILNKFGSEKYSKEELVAEIGASLIRALVGINDTCCDDNSIAYLKGWVSHLKSTAPTEISYAAQQAQKAVNYILQSINYTENKFF